ncbi:MAG: hypothetical protein FWD88_02095, partial [Treponema sp.]|nr:hypothetical protein [Treponema sp.]
KPNGTAEFLIRGEGLIPRCLQRLKLKAGYYPRDHFHGRTKYLAACCGVFYLISGSLRHIRNARFKPEALFGIGGGTNATPQLKIAQCLFDPHNMPGEWKRLTVPG